MEPLFSQRFGCSIQVTLHAQRRMVDRGVTRQLLIEIIELGTIKWKDSEHLWIFHSAPDRNDNLLCVAAILQSAMIIKTVMHHFNPEDQP